MIIGIFSDTWLPNINGVTFSIINEIKALSDQHEFVLFVPKTADQDLGMSVDCPVYSISSFDLPFYPGYRVSLPFSSILKNSAKDHPIDFIHIHSPFFLGYYGLMAKKLFRIPSIATYHTWLSEYAGHITRGFAEERVKKFLEIPIWKYTKWFFSQSEFNTTPSVILEQEMKRWSVPDVISLPNPISPIFFDHQSTKSKSASFKKKFGIPADKKLILYVGRISFEKRLETLFKAYKNLQDKSSLKEDIFLAIVGEGPHLDSYRKMAVDLGLKDYKFTGYVNHNDLPSVYAAGDVFVSPSDTETQGLTYIEAMASGVTVIGTKAGGVIDYIKHGETGLLAQERTPEQFEQLITFSLENEKEMEKIKTKAKAVADKYSYDSFKRTLNTIIDQACEKYRKK
ncbi:MAG: glycosyltransferase [Candidatus Hodarchaeales archaeon]